jgi:hypothetical protein
MDAHWQPYSMLCQVCKLKYNFIGKYETIDKDLPYLLKHVNLSDWDFGKRRGKTGRTTWDYRQMFSHLSDKLICQLKHLYDDDLRLFSYQLEDYVDRPSLFCHHNAT